MKYIFLGNSGLKVSPICLGTMTFGEDWGWGSNKKISKSIFDEFVSKGGNFIDTANIYTDGSSEKYLAEMINPIREFIVLGTKYTLSPPTNDPNQSGNSRKTLRQSVEASLKRLKTDYIDVLWLHIWDFTTPVEEVMKSLDNLVTSGKVNYIGISDTPAWVVAKANTLAKIKGYTPFIANQIEYNLIERAPERDILPMANDFGMGITAWSPLGAGLLTGKYLDNDKKGGRLEDKTSYRFNKKNIKIVTKVVEIANKLDISPAQLSLAWLVNQGVIPIIGARNMEQMKSNMASLDIKISNKYMKALNEISGIDLGFPHTFSLRPGALSYTYGGMVDKISGVNNSNLKNRDQLLKIADGDK